MVVVTNPRITMNPMHTIPRCNVAVTLSMGLVLAAAVLTACDAMSQGAIYGNAPEYTLSDTALVSIGGLDERPEYQMYRVVSSMRLSNGRIVIADAGNRNLRYYDANGSHIRTVGGSGEGPGEFNNVKSVARLPGDTLAVLDAVLRRVTLFTREGDLVRTVTLEGWASAVDDLMREDPGRVVGLHDFHVLGSGEIIVEPFFERSPAAMETTRLIQDTVPLLVFDRAGAMERALGPFPASEAFLRNRIGMLLAFGERLSVAAGNHLLYVGSTRHPTIQGISPDGRVVRSIDFPGSPRPVSQQDRPQAGSGPAGEHVAAMPLPDSMPLFSRMVHGADGRLWVQRYKTSRDRVQEWLCFDESGNVVGALPMDAHMEVLDIGSDYILVLHADDLGVQQVLLHRLVTG